MRGFIPCGQCLEDMFVAKGVINPCWKCLEGANGVVNPCWKYLEGMFVAKGVVKTIRMELLSTLLFQQYLLILGGRF